MSPLKVFLLLLLPSLLLYFYIDGQRYNPDLLTFKGGSGLRGPGRFLPKTVSGYERRGAVSSYSKERLYEYVNGHADFFISGGFKALSVGYYHPQSSRAKDDEIVIDVYNLEKSENALGVLMAETGASATELDLGFLAYKTDRTVYFVKGPYYVKLSAYKSNAPLEALGRIIDKGMGELETVIPLLEKFPLKQHAVKGSLHFFKNDFRGLPFAKNVYEQGFKMRGTEFQIALSENRSGEGENGLQAYIGYIQEEGFQYEFVANGEAGYYRIVDPFEGNWFLLSRGDLLYSVYGVQDETFLENILNHLQK